MTPSPPRTEGRSVGGQGLLLSRTMLSNQGLPYVGRFAYGWHRLATTDPHTAHGAVYGDGCGATTSSMRRRRPRPARQPPRPPARDGRRQATRGHAILPPRACSGRRGADAGAAQADRGCPSLEASDGALAQWPLPSLCTRCSELRRRTTTSTQTVMSTRGLIDHRSTTANCTGQRHGRCCAKNLASKPSR